MSATPPNGGSDQDHKERNSPQFTAVNGTAATTNGNHNTSNNNNNGVNGSHNHTAEHDSKPSAPAAESNTNANMNNKRKRTPESPEPRATPPKAYNQPRSRPRSPQVYEQNIDPQFRQPTPPASSHSAYPPPSDEPSRAIPPGAAPPPEPVSQNGPPPTNGAQSSAMNNRHAHQPPAQAAGDERSGSGSAHTYPPPPEERATSNGTWYEENSPRVTNGSSGQPHDVDARLVEALGRHDSEHDGNQRWGINRHPDIQPAQRSYPYSEDSDQRMPVSNPLQKRKRQFSNRTKTGCQTCRKRKKKCDEAKPSCKYRPRVCPEVGSRLVD